MKVKNSLILSSVLVLALILLYLSYFLVGRFTLDSYSLSSIPLTYSVESFLLSALGRNRLSVSSKTIKSSLLSLEYVTSAEVLFRGKEIIVSGKIEEEGVIITDGERWYFFSSSLSPLSEKDVSVLSSSYTILRVDKELIESMIEYSPSRNELKMISILSQLKQSSNLITMAEYGNNEMVGYPLSLTLRLDSLSSALIVENISDAGRIEEALEIIENEYEQTERFTVGEWRTYVLSGGRLIETR